MSGALSVRKAGELAERLRAALGTAGALTLDLSDVAEADLSFVQLVESARVSAARKGVPLALARPADGAVLSVLERGGFLDPAAPERVAFWTGAAQ